MAPRFPRRERHVREDLDAAPPLRRVVHLFTRRIEHDELREARVGEVHRDRVQPDICQGYTDLRQVPWIVDRLVHLGSECEVRFCCAPITKIEVSADGPGNGIIDRREPWDRYQPEGAT